MPLAAYDRSWFDMQLRRELSVRDGTAFQRLFADIMKRRHRAEFVTVCPWGNDGDWKNDGYLAPTRELFQCYAPRELKKTPTRTKIRADFKGAHEKWKDHFDFWVFVHNVTEGVPPFALAELLQLSTRHAPTRAIAWGFEELRELVLSLRRSDCVELFGTPVTDEDFYGLEFNDIIGVLTRVAAHEPDPNAPVAVVPPGKLAANELPESIADFLRMGMRRTRTVEQCFAADRDPTLGDRAATAFKAKYQELRSERRFTPAVIFDELRSFAGGAGRQSTAHQAAVLAVLAYFFESCDIFEPPRSPSSPVQV